MPQLLGLAFLFGGNVQLKYMYEACGEHRGVSTGDRNGLDEFCNHQECAVVIVFLRFRTGLGLLKMVRGNGSFPRSSFLLPFFFRGAGV